MSGILARALVPVVAVAAMTYIACSGGDGNSTSPTDVPMADPTEMSQTVEAMPSATLEQMATAVPTLEPTAEPTATVSYDPRFPPVDLEELGPNDIILPVACGTPFEVSTITYGAGLLTRFDGLPLDAELIMPVDGQEVTRRSFPSDTPFAGLTNIRYELSNGSILDISVSSKVLPAPIDPLLNGPFVRRGETITTLSSDISTGASEYDNASLVLSLASPVGDGSFQFIDVINTIKGCD